MAKVRILAYASFFKRTFKDTVFEKHFIKRHDTEKLEVCIVPPHQARSIKQNSTFWGLVSAIFMSGETEFSTPEEMRRHFMARAGLIEYKYISRSPEFIKAMKYVAKVFWYNKDLQEEILSTIKEKKVEKYTSLSLASSKTLAFMIDDIINYYKSLGKGINEVEEILKGIDYY